MTDAKPTTDAPRPGWLRAARLALAGLVAVSGAVGAQPVRVADEYLLDRWTTAEGLPVGDATAVRIARSGYLWLTTFDGLVRFDGRRFDVYNTSRNPELPSNRLIWLGETSDGMLWLATEHFSLARFDGVRFQPIGRRQGLPHDTVLTQHLDTAGGLWVGTPGGLALRDAPGEHGKGPGRSDDAFRPWAAGSISGAVRAILPLADGRVWVGTDRDGLYELDGETVRRRYRRREGPSFDSITALETDTEGGLWVGSEHGVARLQGDTVERLETLDDHPIVDIRATPDGSVLIVTIWRSYEWRAGELRPRSDRPTARRVELLRVDPAGAVWTVDQEVLARDGREVLEAPCAITGFDFDATGAVWLATACDGLWRLRQRRTIAITPSRGLPRGPVYGLAQTTDGTLWATTGGGTVSEIRGDRVVAVHDTSVPGQTLRTLLARPDGSLWLGHDGVCRLIDGSCERPADQPGILEGSTVRAVQVSRDGSLWVGSQAGLWRRDAAGWRIADEELLLPPWVVVRAIHEAASGNLWLATTRDGLRRLTGNGEVSRYATEHGLASASIRDLHEDERGHLWVAAEDRGVCRSRDPEDAADLRFDCLGEAEGLHSASLHRILADDHGRLWFNSNSGVFVVDRQALESALAGRSARIYSRAFTERDGLPDREGNGGVQGAGVRLADGRLVFPGQGGITIFDPRRVRSEPRPPRATIEGLVLPGGRELPARPEIALPRGQRVFSLQFTVLTPGLTDPHFFRYRVQPGANEAWTELGTDRSLSFERMPPGRHTFELVALDAATGATGPVAEMRLLLPAYLHETVAFRIGLLFAVAAVAAVGVWHQLRKAAIRQRQLEHAVDRRTAELRAQQAATEAQRAATETALATVRRQRNEIESLAEARTRYFADVSHELRTPLTLLIGPLEDYSQDAPPTDEQAVVMRRNANRLQRLVEQLLDLERIEAGRFPLRLATIDLARLARDSASAFTVLAEREGIDLDLAVPDEAMPVRVDPEQIGRVIGNLLSNALKFTPHGGRVRLSLRREPAVAAESAPPGQAELAVEDTGPGVPPEWRQRIFDRFSQMGSEAVRGREGSGLGLALCREVVDLHDGTLFVEPAATGGSRFVVTLPLAPHVAASQAAAEAGKTVAAAVAAEAASLESLRAPETETPPAGRPATPPVAATATDGDTTAAPPSGRRRVLVAEDHGDLRRYIESVLAADYDVETVGDGEAALAAAWRRPPDVVVSDIVMPRRDGLALARALRDEPELAGIPLIFLTARVTDRDEIAGLAIGADQYLKKPFHGEVLKAHVAAAIRACERLRDRFAREASRGADGRDGKAPSTPEHAASLPERVRDWIENNAHEESLSIDDLAAALYMSRRALERNLHAATGMSPAEYIRTVRLARARRLLGESAGTVSEVAYAVGFNSLSAFSRAYRAAFGEPPSRHRAGM